MSDYGQITFDDLEDDEQRTGSIAGDFEKFDRENPRVAATLVDLAREWLRRTGRHEIGVAMLYERCRWEIAIATNDPSFKLNNNYQPYFARKIMLENADLAGVFKLRRADADEWAAARYDTAA